MSNSTRKPRKVLTPQERLAKVTEHRQAAYRQVVKQILGDNPKFKEIKETILKTKKFLHESENLLTEEGFTKVKTRIEERISDLHEQLSQLNEKRNVATSSVDALREKVQSFDSIQLALGQKLEQLMNSDDLTEDTVSTAVENILADTTIEPTVDPFAQWRRQKPESEDTTEETV
jgi:chromosome segregation ATPase